MEKHQERFTQTLGFLNNHDIDPGFRRLLDCVADTQNMTLYQQAIQLTDWKEEYPDDIDGLIERSKALLLQTEKHPIMQANTSAPVVIATDIYKRYKSGVFTLGPVSVEIKKGQVYGLVGENGNGKTTLLRILAKELKENSGNIQYQFSTPATDDFELRTKLIYIPQRTKKWYGSLKDNLKLVLSSYQVPPAQNETRVLFMMARLGLWKYRNLQWHQLSSGYKMRFELARTLLRKPELLLLDEPLANLDVLAQQIILEDLKSIANSITNPIALILSSQQLYEVEKISDKVIYLKNGQYTDRDFSAAPETIDNLIVEVETRETRERLLEVLSPLSPEKITYNGGVYIAYFNNSVLFNDVLAAIGAQCLDITYVRNISNSTRKYFVV